MFIGGASVRIQIALSEWIRDDVEAGKDKEVKWLSKSSSAKPPWLLAILNPDLVARKLKDHKRIPSDVPRGIFSRPLELNFGHPALR